MLQIASNIYLEKENYKTLKMGLNLICDRPEYATARKITPKYEETRVKRGSKLEEMR